MDSKILLFIIKLVLGGITAFFAILLMSKKRTLSWAFMTGGFLLSYASLVYELLIELGVLTATKYVLFGMPAATVICTILPALCFITAFILLLVRK